MLFGAAKKVGTRRPHQCLQFNLQYSTGPCSCRYRLFLEAERVAQLLHPCAAKLPVLFVAMSYVVLQPSCRLQHTGKDWV